MMIEIQYNDKDKTHMVSRNTEHVARIEQHKEGHTIYLQRGEWRVAPNTETAIDRILKREMGSIT